MNQVKKTIDFEPRNQLENQLQDQLENQLGNQLAATLFAPTCKCHCAWLATILPSLYKPIPMSFPRLHSQALSFTRQQQKFAFSKTINTSGLFQDSTKARAGFSKPVCFLLILVQG